MRDVLPELMRSSEAGETIGVGTVVTTFQLRAPPSGHLDALGPDETAVGSVSGGCIEGPSRPGPGGRRVGRSRCSERYGVTDEDAFAVGLTCGGILDV